MEDAPQTSMPDNNNNDEEKPRYLPTYREDEIQLICDHALVGRSLCFVGVAGMGKSNITDLLCQNKYNYKPRYLGVKTKRVHFPRVDATVWDDSPGKLWRLMLQGLVDATQSLASSPSSSPKVLPMAGKEERDLVKLREYIRWVCHDMGHQVMFMFDDIDEVLATAPVSMLNTLYSLRGDNKDRLSFLFFVKGLPHLLRRERGLDENVELFKLINSSTYALKPYNDTDARQMLEYLNSRATRPLPPRELLPILNLCGGHAGLLKTIYNIWLDNPSPDMNPLVFYRNSPDIARECRRIVDKLHPHEQEAAKRVARNQQTLEDSDVIDLLHRRGLITSTNPLTWFSELGAIFLREEWR